MSTAPLLNDDQIRTPRTVRPIVSSDEILGHVDRAMSTLPPEAHEAIGQAHSILGVNAPAAPEESFDGIKPPRIGGLPSVGVDAARESPGIGSGPSRPLQLGPTVAESEPPDMSAVKVPSISGIKSPSRIANAAAPPPSSNAERLQHLRDTGSGISQIKSPFARVPLQILDAVGRGLFPGIEMGIPGTSGHHDVLTHQARNAVTDEQEAQAAQDESELKAAQTANQASLPELHQTQTDLAAAKQAGIDEHNRATEAQAATTEQGRRDTAAAARKATLASHGFEEDEKGNIVPLAYERMSQEQQAVHDLKAAQTEAAEAEAALRKAQAKNQPALVALQQKRLDSAREAHGIAARRLGLSERQFEMRAYGTGEAPQGGDAHQPLPGTLQTDEGQTVGTANAPNVRPTGQERNKADMAGSAKEQLADIRKIVQNRPDIFGPVEGRKTDFDTWVGSQDPDAQRFRSARTIAADHLAGTFGGRSEAALEALDAAIGSFKDNPKAVMAGLDQIDKANNIFIEKGTPKTTGSNAAKKPLPPPKAGEVRDGYKYKGGPVNEQSSWEAVKK